MQMRAFSGLSEKQDGSQGCRSSGNAGREESRSYHIQAGDGDLNTGALKITVRTLAYILRWRAGGGF